MPWHDRTPWAWRKEQAAEQKRKAADAALERVERERRVEEIRQALRTFDFGGMSVDRFLVEVQQIATDGAAKIGQQHKPEIQG
jgi:hypothetical protein